ncbi:hypothetical protein J5U18_06235 [Sphingobacteriaceae bacterium WQ 2009]|uniref:Uncharacterized protein n=1 Tax=Rhinopithecimicrobium faecis TaxID=2820698 RepID=A0A8T4H9R4_9SPHI|nr:hypothetical protein [Sphingobacteriaceae bacterium WQ 2009]
MIFESITANIDFDNYMKAYRYLFLLILLWGIKLPASATVQDSLSYEQQRSHLNKLLQERSERFKAFDTSLAQKTGIFGFFKTQDDMQKSIDILKDVVVTDNNIFLETKKLLDFKDFEREKFQKLANEYDQQITAYMKTINKLQTENEKLRNHIKEEEKSTHSGSIWLYLSLLGNAALLFMYVKQQKLTKK